MAIWLRNIPTALTTISLAILLVSCGGANTGSNPQSANPPVEQEETPADTSETGDEQVEERPVDWDEIIWDESDWT